VSFRGVKRRNAALPFVAVLCLAVASVVVGTGTIDTVAGAIVKISAPIVTPGTALNDMTLGITTSIDATDMVTSTLGYGVASSSGPSRNWYYLIKTTNAATSWTVRGALPFQFFTGVGNGFIGATLHFVTTEIGYTSVYRGSLYVTMNAGATWSKVRTPGIWPSLVTSGSRVTVVSDVCHGPQPSDVALKCPSELSSYRLGATQPLHSFAIPGEGVGPWRSAVALAATSATSMVVAEGNNEGGASSLLSTANDGASWRRLADPCEGLIVLQLITSLPGRWLLYCFLDGGMNQGTSALYRSNNAGASWSVVSKETEMNDVIGNIGDVMLRLAVTTNRKIIFGGVDSAAGGIQYSTDGGVRWIRVHKSIPSGGAPETLSTFGATGAVLDVGNGTPYRTVNGTSWRALAPLSAGKYRGLRICTEANGTKVAEGKAETGIPATTLNIPIRFTNEGAAPCYLDGSPAFVAKGADAQRVTGQEVSEITSGEPPFVVLKAHGGVASVWFDVESVKDYSKKYCVAESFDEIDIQFPSPASFPLSTATLSACSGASTLSISSVRSGLQTFQ
jgi:hypothetical protein